MAIAGLSGSWEGSKYYNGTKLEQAVDYKHSIYYKGEKERVGGQQVLTPNGTDHYSHVSTGLCTGLYRDSIAFTNTLLKVAIRS